MRIPMKVDYGVRALVDLAQYATPGRLIRTAEIASREAIPEPYLDQVLRATTVRDLVERQPRGEVEVELVGVGR